MSSRNSSAKRNDHRSRNDHASQSNSHRSSQRRNESADRPASPAQTSKQFNPANFQNPFPASSFVDKGPRRTSSHARSEQRHQSAIDAMVSGEVQSTDRGFDPPERERGPMKEELQGIDASPRRMINSAAEFRRSGHGTYRDLPALRIVRKEEITMSLIPGDSAGHRRSRRGHRESHSSSERYHRRVEAAPEKPAKESLKVKLLKRLGLQPVAK